VHFNHILLYVQILNSGAEHLLKGLDR